MEGVNPHRWRICTCAIPAVKTDLKGLRGLYVLDVKKNDNHAALAQKQQYHWQQQQNQLT